jgi:hypothetical protein
MNELDDDTATLIFQYLTVNELYHNISLVNKSWYQALRGDEETAFHFYKRYHQTMIQDFSNSSTSKRMSFKHYSMYCECLNKDDTMKQLYNGCIIVDIKHQMPPNLLNTNRIGDWEGVNYPDYISSASLDPGHWFPRLFSGDSNDPRWPLAMFIIQTEGDNCIVVFSTIDNFYRHGLEVCAYTVGDENDIIYFPYKPLCLAVQSGQTFFDYYSNSEYKVPLQFHQTTNEFYRSNTLLISESWNDNSPAVLYKIFLSPPGDRHEFSEECFLPMLKKLLITGTNDNIYPFVFKKILRYSNRTENCLKYLINFMKVYKDWTDDDLFKVLSDNRFATTCITEALSQTEAAKFYSKYVSNTLTEMILNYLLDKLLGEKFFFNIIDIESRRDLFRIIYQNSFRFSSCREKWKEFIQLKIFQLLRIPNALVPLMDILSSLCQVDDDFVNKLKNIIAEQDILFYYLSSIRVSPDIVKALITIYQQIGLKDHLRDFRNGQLTILDELISRQQLDDFQDIIELLSNEYNVPSYFQRPTELTNN